jgi:signal transduction histidine kinase/ActR/RegA family two-component response regulator
VVEDYSHSRYALAALREKNFNTAIASPIRIGQRISAVLVAGADRPDRKVTMQDREAFDLLAGLVERALENASRFQELQETAAELRASTERREKAEAEKARLEAQLRQSQKLEAVGLLAGGVAHDFNNLLSVIQNYTEFVHEALDPTDPSREDLEEVLAAGERGTSLVRQLLTFSRREVVRPQVLDLNYLIAEMKKMLQTTVTAAVSVTLDLEDNLEPVELDPAQIQQILMNLTVNARDAMPNGGSLIVTTENVIVDDSFELEEGCRPGPHVSLSVSDTGEGMTDEVRARIFEPFYTTKHRESGTGLGLATVYGIVRQAKGHVAVDSEPGIGTTFRIYLPVALESEVVHERPTPRSAEGRGERVLVAEDEEAICRIIARILPAHGYEAKIMSSPLEALEAAKHEDFDLLVSDVVMPKMSGKQLSDAVKELQPDIKVLYTSGYAEGIVAEQGVIRGTDMLLQKPFSSDALLTAMRQVLDGRSERRLAERGA